MATSSQNGASRANAWFIAACLIATVAFGGTLRAWLGGSGWLPLDFRHLRHAHTHLGWYGAVFPLAFGVWRRQGWWTPGPRLLLSYGAAVVLATAGFLRAGYGIGAIAGSTWVLAVWLMVAFRNRRQLHWRREDWLAAVPILVVLTSLTIPLIAITFRRNPGLSARWVQTFMTLLLFGVGMPTALTRAGFRAPPGALWGGAVVACALWVGVVPALWLRPGVWLLGGLLLGTAWTSRGARWDLRFGLVAVALGLLAVATGSLAFDPGVAVAGVHLAVLGPMLGGLHGDPVRTKPLSVLLLALLLGMCGGILMISRGVPYGAEIAAVAGVLLALGWTIALITGVSHGLAAVSRAARPLSADTPRRG